MKIFLDSVDIVEIRKFVDYGVIDGITTNPTLIASTQMSFIEVVSLLSDLPLKNVSIEVLSNNFKDMVKEANKILEINDSLVIKLPITWDGIKACNYFAKQNIKVNMTLCFCLNQALLAARSGATYVSPFIGRLEDSGGSGIDLISNIKSIYSNYAMNTEILAASIRTLEHVEQVALKGADIVTLPVKILSKILDHQLTDIGLKKFNDDWKKSGKNFLN